MATPLGSRALGIGVAITLQVARHSMRVIPALRTRHGCAIARPRNIEHYTIARTTSGVGNAPNVGGCAPNAGDVGIGARVHKCGDWVGSRQVLAGTVGGGRCQDTFESCHCRGGQQVHGTTSQIVRAASCERDFATQSVRKRPTHRTWPHRQANFLTMLLCDRVAARVGLHALSPSLSQMLRGIGS